MGIVLTDYLHHEALKQVTLHKSILVESLYIEKLNNYRMNADIHHAFSIGRTLNIQGY